MKKEKEECRSICRPQNRCGTRRACFQSFAHPKQKVSYFPPVIDKVDIIKNNQVVDDKNLLRKGDADVAGLAEDHAELGVVLPRFVIRASASRRTLPFSL